MRVTIVIGPFLPIPPVLGGAVEKVHCLLAKAYRDAGHQVTIVSRRYDSFANDEVVEGIRHLRIASFDAASSLTVNLARDLSYGLRVVRALPAADVTVTNSFSLPVLVPRRRAGKIYVHVARFPKGQMRLYARADRLQAISRAVAQAIVSQAPRLADRVVTIGYPVDDAYFRADGAVQRRKIILYVGRLAREKGVHLLLAAFRRAVASCPAAAGWKLRIIGPHAVEQGGSGQGYLGELQALAGPLGERCQFAGPVFDQDALLGEYRAASVFAYPSLASHGEAFGLAALEAMAAGCAVVVSDLACFADFVEDEVTGLTFARGCADPERALAERLMRLMTDRALADRIVAGGRRAANSFRTPTIADRMLNDFAGLLSRPPH
jgi:glycosyltransferase involved in cell wall biosynthesis